LNRLVAVAGLLVGAIAFAPSVLSMSMIAPPPIPSRLSMADEVLVGRYVIGDSVDVAIVDTVLFDSRPAAARAASARLRELPRVRGKIRTSEGPAILLLASRPTHAMLVDLAPIPLPATIEECDRVLDTLSDSLAVSRDPRFGSLARYVLQLRERLPLAQSHEFRKVAP
jgi:hypothetical protein